MFEVRVGECYESADKYFATKEVMIFETKEQAIIFIEKQLDENLKPFAVNCVTTQQLIETWKTYGDFYFISGDEDYYFSIHYVEENATKILEIINEKKKELDSINFDGDSYLYGSGDKEDEFIKDIQREKKSSVLNLISSWPRHPFPNIHKQYTKALEILLQLYPNLEEKTNDKYKRTALHIACKEGNFTAVELLLKHRANPNSYDAENSQPLEYMTNYAWRARLDGMIPIYQLIKCGADINNLSLGEDAQTALGWTIIYGGNQLSVVSLLLENKADVNLANNKGDTPLMLAALSDRVDICWLLYMYDVDLYAKNNEGKTALDIAKEEKREKVISFLEEAIKEDKEG